MSCWQSNSTVFHTITVPELCYPSVLCHAFIFRYFRQFRAFFLKNRWVSGMSGECSLLMPLNSNRFFNTLFHDCSFPHLSHNTCNLPKLVMSLYCEPYLHKWIEDRCLQAVPNISSKLYWEGKWQ